MAKYGEKAKKKITKVMKEYKKGDLNSGKSKIKVKSRKQAVAIAISEARREGDKVPEQKSDKSSTKNRQKKTTARWSF